MGYNIDALVKAYEDWKKTPLGKKCLEEEKAWIPIEIPKAQLPMGWHLTDGGMKEGYFVYSDPDGNEVHVEASYDGIPVHLGGYPDHHSIEVSVVEVDDSDSFDEEEEDRDRDEPRSIGKYYINKFGWKKAFEMANELALQFMKDLM